MSVAVENFNWNKMVNLKNFNIYMNYIVYEKSLPGNIFNITFVIVLFSNSFIL